MENDLNKLLERYGEQVAAALNVLVECSYFYIDDDEDLFYFMRRYKHEFSEFYRKYYDWEFIIDSKCARVYKNKWYNNSVKPEQRAQFRITGRDEAIAFMCLLEFFEHQLDDNSITAEEKHNLRFRFGDLLQYCFKRFAELFEEISNDTEQSTQNSDRKLNVKTSKTDPTSHIKEQYSEENIRSKILRPLMPKLLQFRFLKEIRPEQNMNGLNRYNNDFIYEALPALYHYNTGRLSKAVVDNVAAHGSALTNEVETQYFASKKENDRVNSELSTLNSEDKDNDKVETQYFASKNDNDRDNSELSTLNAEDKVNSELSTLNSEDKEKDNDNGNNGAYDEN